MQTTFTALEKSWLYVSRRPVLLVALALGALVLVDVMAPDVAWAGPGGQFVKSVAKTFWGKMALGALGIIFLPLIAYVLIREAWAVRGCKRDLAQLAERLPFFAWEVIETRAREAVEALYAAWGTGDLGSAAAYLTTEFYASQQDMLDRWKEEGKRNVFELKGEIRLAPLHVIVETADKLSSVSVRCKAMVVDYMELLETGKVVKGKPAGEELETCLQFVHADGDWLLHAIDEGSNSLVIATEQNQLDASYLLGMSGGSEFSGADAPQHPATAEAKAGTVGVADDDEDDRQVGDIAER